MTMEERWSAEVSKEVSRARRESKNEEPPTIVSLCSRYQRSPKMFSTKANALRLIPIRVPLRHRIPMLSTKYVHWTTWTRAISFFWMPATKLPMILVEHNPPSVVLFVARVEKKLNSAFVHNLLPLHCLHLFLAQVFFFYFFDPVYSSTNARWATIIFGMLSVLERTHWNGPKYRRFAIPIYPPLPISDNPKLCCPER